VFRVLQRYWRPQLAPGGPYRPGLVARAWPGSLLSRGENPRAGLQFCGSGWRVSHGWIDDRSRSCRGPRDRRRGLNPFAVNCPVNPTLVACWLEVARACVSRLRPERIPEPGKSKTLRYSDLRLRCVGEKGTHWGQHGREGEKCARPARQDAGTDVAIPNSKPPRINAGPDRVHIAGRTPRSNWPPGALNIPIQACTNAGTAVATCGKIKA